MGVDPGAVIDELRAGHPGGQRGLVEHVAAGDRDAARGELGGRGIGAREPDEVIAALDQPWGSAPPMKPVAPVTKVRATAGNTPATACGHTIFPGLRFAPGSVPSNSARNMPTPGAEMSCSSHAACSVPTA